MKTYKLKSVARRGSMLGAAFAIVASSFVPVITSYADALNPLTDRSLTLSSSAPGWDYKDGSGNTTYAVPNSGANGQKTGNTFAFKVSTDSTAAGTNSPIKAMTFQYCTKPAGDCMGPGDVPFVGTAGSYTHASNATAAASQKSDLEVITSGQSEITGANFSSYVNNANGAIKSVPAPSTTGSNYVVYYLDKTDTTAAPTGTWKQSTGWVMQATVAQTAGGVAGTVGAGTSTGKANNINLVHTGAGQGLVAGTAVKVVFFGTSSNYITNPGSGAFFVKINTYKAFTDSVGTDATPFTADDTYAMNPLDVIDGGVTVANVMNLSIEIQTKVLETMDFSVGTVDPFTLTDAQLTTASNGKYSTHGICNPILNSMNPTDLTNNPLNTLILGDEGSEHSLAVDHTYSTHSYFRLSSNASAGATVYYAGVTLSNTVGDQIKAIGPTKAAPSPGSEQFGLALDNGVAPNWAVDYNTERASGKVYESGADNTAKGLVDLQNAVAGATGVDSSVTADWTSQSISGKMPQLQVFSADSTSLAPTANYDQGTGVVNGGTGGYGTINTKFAFDTTSNTIPVPIAQESQHVVDCASGKIRYIANIAATTPAGIYTTKVNYIAAPQY